MNIDAAKLRVLIPTTSATVEVLLLTEEDRAIGRSVACIGGTTETADIAAAYHAFVVRPTGIIEGLFGHPCYRLDVSGRIDAGSSWQLGVLVAHALHAVGRLAQEGDIASGIIWATGSVRPVDLTVGGVSHVQQKLANSTNRLKQEAAAGRRVLMAVPYQNAPELTTALKTDLAAHGIEVLALSHVQPLWDRLSLKLPSSLRSTAAGSANRGEIRSPMKFRRRYVWGAAAAALLCALGIGTVAIHSVGQPPVSSQAEKQTSTPSPGQGGSKTAALVPEMVPLVSEREQAVIRGAYMPAPDFKALALSINRSYFVTAQHDQRSADAAAIAACRERNSNCELYASGNFVVSSRDRPPMPEPPWFVRNPLIETRFDATDLPLAGQSNLQFIAKTYPGLDSPKALALSPAGHFGIGWDESNERVIRAALERCGYRAEVACMIIARDDAFVVPIPKSAKVTGFYRSAALSMVAPELRDEVARQLGDARGRWNAVAVGVSGRVGVKLDAESEHAATDGALQACAGHDQNCRIAVIGPFLVEWQPAQASPP